MSRTGQSRSLRDRFPPPIGWDVARRPLTGAGPGGTGCRDADRRVQEGRLYGDMRASPQGAAEDNDPPLCWLPRARSITPRAGRRGCRATQSGPRGLPLHFSFGRCRPFVLCVRSATGCRRGGLRAGCEVPVGRVSRAVPSEGRRPLRVRLNGWQTARRRRLPPARPIHRQAARRGREDGRGERASGSRFSGLDAEIRGNRRELQGRVVELRWAESTAQALGRCRTPMRRGRTSSRRGRETARRQEDRGASVREVAAGDADAGGVQLRARTARGRGSVVLTIHDREVRADGVGRTAFPGRPRQTGKSTKSLRVLPRRTALLG